MLPALALGALLAGCSEDPPQPLVTGYPLEEGWSWDYRRVIEVELLNGSRDRTQILDSARVESEGTVTVDGRAAFSLTSAVLSEGPPVRGQDYFQQDRRDLQHLLPASGGGDLDILPKPGRASAPTRAWALPAGPGQVPVQDHVRTVLAFPLIPGNGWVMQVEPRVVTRRVVAEERIATPAGRFDTVRIETTLHGGEPLKYTDWIAEEGLVRRDLDWEVEEYLFPGHSARERIVARIELQRYARP